MESRGGRQPYQRPNATPNFRGLSSDEPAGVRDCPAGLRYSSGTLGGKGPVDLQPGSGLLKAETTGRSQTSFPSSPPSRYLFSVTLTRMQLGAALLLLTLGCGR